MLIKYGFSNINLLPASRIVMLIRLKIIRLLMLNGAFYNNEFEIKTPFIGTRHRQLTRDDVDAVKQRISDEKRETSERHRAPRTGPIFRRGRLRGKVERAPRGPSRSVLRLSLTSCCGAGVSHRPRRAWHSYSLARTDSSEKARRTHASRPFAVLRATCGRGTSRSWDPFNTRAASRIYRGFLVVISENAVAVSENASLYGRCDIGQGF